MFQVRMLGSQVVVRKRARMPIGASLAGAKPATCMRSVALRTTALRGMLVMGKNKKLRWAPLTAELKPTRRKLSVEKFSVGRLEAVKVSAPTGISRVMVVASPWRVSLRTIGSICSDASGRPVSLVGSKGSGSATP